MLRRLYQTLVVRPYFTVRTWWPLWYYVFNATPRSRFLAARPKLSPLQERIVGELRTDGISVTSLDELFPGEGLLEKLQAWEAAHPPVEDTAGKKKFLREYWPLVPEYDPSNPFLEVALRDTSLDIIESYMGMWARLKQYHLGKTLPDPERAPAGSQQWHRDPEEKRMCKMFIYLNNVDETAGPFTYVPGSTYGNRYGSLFPQATPEGSYPKEADVLKKVGSSLRTMTGTPGSVIFCDTSGLHYGGRATENPRIMFTAGFASPLYSEGSRYTTTDGTKLSTLPEKQRYVLGGRHLTKQTSSMRM